MFDSADRRELRHNYKFMLESLSEIFSMWVLLLLNLGAAIFIELKSPYDLNTDLLFIFAILFFSVSIVFAYGIYCKRLDSTALFIARANPKVREKSNYFLERCLDLIAHFFEELCITACVLHDIFCDAILLSHRVNYYS